MMPLTMASLGEVNYIKRVGGTEEVRNHLASMGFVTGAEIKIISKLAGNVILEVKDTRVALDQGMANKIMV